MTEQAPTSNETPDAQDWARPLVERQLAVLGELAELGLEAARAVERQARAAGPEVDLKRLTLAYARVSRAVRMTIALQSRLIGELKAREDALADDRVEAETWDDEVLAARVETHKVRAVRVVERVLEAEHEDYDTVSRLVLRAERLLDDETLFDDVLSRPIGDLVARICRDLGLSPDWPRLAEEAWAKAEIESGAAGSPFAGLERVPLPLDGGEVRSGGDGSAAVRRPGHPQPQPIPHQGGRESQHAASP